MLKIINKFIKLSFGTIIPVSLLTSCLQSTDKGYNVENIKAAEVNNLAQMISYFNKAKTVQEVEANKTIQKIRTEDIEKEGFMNFGVSGNGIGSIKLFRFQEEGVVAVPFIDFSTELPAGPNQAANFFKIEQYDEDGKYRFYRGVVELKIEDYDSSRTGTYKLLIPDFKTVYRLTKT
jgi:hypothetical protein